MTQAGLVKPHFEGFLAVCDLVGSLLFGDGQQPEEVDVVVADVAVL